MRDARRDVAPCQLIRLGQAGPLVCPKTSVLQDTSANASDATWKLTRKEPELPPKLAREASAGPASGSRRSGSDPEADPGRRCCPWREESSCLPEDRVQPELDGHKPGPWSYRAQARRSVRIMCKVGPSIHEQRTGSIHVRRTGSVHVRRTGSVHALKERFAGSSRRNGVERSAPRSTDRS